jgi:hypothetical protein
VYAFGNQVAFFASSANPGHGGQHPEEHAHGLGGGPQRRQAGAGGQREDDQHDIGRVDQLLERLGRDQRDQAGDQDDMGATAGGAAGQPDEQLQR